MLEVDLLLHPSFRFKSSSAENSGVGIVNSVRFKGESMKLAARSAGLPGNDLLFDTVPLPACRQAGTPRRGRGLRRTLRSRSSVHFGVSFPGCGDVFLLFVGSMLPDCPNDRANGHHARYLGKSAKNGCIHDRSRG